MCGVASNCLQEGDRLTPGGRHAPGYPVEITLCVIRRMFDVESPMRFESALSVPKIVKSLHVVTSLLIAYDGPRGLSMATRLSEHK